ALLQSARRMAAVADHVEAAFRLDLGDHRDDLGGADVEADQKVLVVFWFVHGWLMPQEPAREQHRARQSRWDSADPLDRRAPAAWRVWVRTQSRNAAAALPCARGRGPARRRHQGRASMRAVARVALAPGACRAEPTAA